MKPEDYEELAEIILDAVEESEMEASSFLERHGSAPIRNAKTLGRIALIVAKLRAHDDFEVRYSNEVEGGRIRFCGSDGQERLLKAIGSLRHPVAEQAQLPGMYGVAHDPVIAYESNGSMVTLYEGFCREVTHRGKRTFEIVGELKSVWSGDGVTEFDQGEDSDMREEEDWGQEDVGQ